MPRAPHSRAHELAPHDGNATWALARHLMLVGQTESAAALMAEVIAHDPLDVTKLTAAAWAFAAGGRHEDGLKAVRRALALAPGRADVVRAAARQMRLAGQDVEAETVLRQAMAAHPEEHDLYVHLAWALEGQNRYEEAWQALEHALAKQPGSHRAHYSMAEMLSFHGRNAEAADHARRAMRAHDASDLFPDVFLARALASLGRLDEAEQVLHEAIARNPRHAYLNAHLAMVAALRGDVASIRPAAEAETDPFLRSHALAIAEVFEGSPEEAGAIARRHLDDCTERRYFCLESAAILHAIAGQPGPMFDLLEEAADQPGWRPDMGHPFLVPYLHHPRFLALLERYGLSPPSPVSQHALAR